MQSYHVAKTPIWGKNQLSWVVAARLLHSSCRTQPGKRALRKGRGSALKHPNRWRGSSCWLGRVLIRSRCHGRSYEQGSSHGGRKQKTELRSGGEFFPQRLQAPSPPNAERARELGAAHSPSSPILFLRFSLPLREKISDKRVASRTLPRATSFVSLFCFLAAYGTKSHEREETKGKIPTPNTSLYGRAAFDHDLSSLIQVVGFPLGIEVSLRNTVVL